MPGPGRGIGQCGDDHQLVGVGHDRPLVRVVVVGGSAQHGAALASPRRSGPGCPGSPVVSPTTRTRSPTMTDARPSWRALVAVTSRSSSQRPVATAVDGDHRGDLGGAVVGPILGSGPGPAARTLERLVLVGPQVPRGHDVAAGARRPASDRAPNEVGDASRRPRRSRPACASTARRTPAWSWSRSRCRRSPRRPRPARAARRRGPSGGRRRCARWLRPATAGGWSGRPGSRARARPAPPARVANAASRSVS